jgi:hypothetical protein
MSDQAEGKRCPDDGKCHHGCLAGCFRVNYCGPLSGVYPGDNWPEGVRRQHRTMHQAQVSEAVALGLTRDSLRAVEVIRERYGPELAADGPLTDPGQPQPAPDSDAAIYLALVTEHGPCVCGPSRACSEQHDTVITQCQLCHHLDPEWPCPNLDDDAEYPPIPDNRGVARCWCARASCPGCLPADAAGFVILAMAEGEDEWGLVPDLFLGDGAQAQEELERLQRFAQQVGRADRYAVAPVRKPS